MSKFYELYKQLKNKDENMVYLFKSGLFYIALADDAILLSNQFNLKLTNLNKNIVKCGFPVSSLNKYSKLLDIYNIKFKIIEFMANSNDDSKFNNILKDIIKSLQDINTENLSISEAYSFIERLKDKAKNIAV